MLQFFGNHLMWFVIGTIVFGFALIGYFVENGFRGKQILKKISVDRPNLENEELEKIKSNISNSNQSLNQVVQGNSEVLEFGGNNMNASNVGAPAVDEVATIGQPITMNNEPVLDLNATASVQQAVVNPQSQVVNPGVVAPLNNGQVVGNTEQAYDQPLMNDESVVSDSGFQG